MGGRAQKRAGRARIAVLSVSALVALTLRFVGGETESEVVEPDSAGEFEVEPAVVIPPLPGTTPDAAVGPDVAFVPRPGMSARAIRQTSRDIAELVVVAEHHDFTVGEQLQVRELLQAEQRQVDALAARGLDDLSLIGEVEELREDTDNAVAEVLSGYSLTAYKLMRAPGYVSERDDELDD